MFKVTKLFFTLTWLVAFLAVGLWMSPGVYAATILVTSSGSGAGACPSASNCTLTTAIASANAGDTINFNGDMNITPSATLNVNKSLIIDGGTNKIVISGGGARRVFSVTGTPVTIKKLTITNGSSGTGAGINATGTSLVIDSVTFSNNTATGGGINNGGAVLYNNNGGSLTIVNSTFSANSADNSGGAVYVDGNTSTNATISFSTFYGNTTGASGVTAIQRNNGTVTLSNNIIHNATNTATCAGTISGTSSGNFADTSACGNTLNVVTDFNTTLTNNGGPASTFALKANSDAINVVSCGTLTTDERGTSRPQGASCDAGAYENTIPTANVQSVTTNEDTAKSITLTGSDPEGGTVTYSVVTQPAHGTLSGTAPNLTYTPATDYNGSDSFTFKVNDGKNDSSAATVSITVNAVNDAPTANAQSVTTNEDTAKGITLSGSDVEGSSLTYSVVTQPTHGTLSGTAPNLTYTPAANYNGPDSFTFKVNDGTVDSSAATVSITVNAVNDAPSFTKGADQTVLEDAGAQSVTGWATSISAGPSDESGQTLTFNVTNNNNSLFSVQPSVDATGKLTYTPAPNANGTALVTISLQDNGGTTNGGVDTSGSQTFNINVTAVNDAPDTSITAQPQNPTNSSSASFSFSGTDVEDGSITNFECALDSDPFAACTSPQSYSNLSDGSHTFNVRAVDSGGSVDPSPATYTWVVDTTPPNTTIDTSPSDPSGSTTADFTFSSSEANSTFACSLDNAAFTSCTSPKQYTGLSSGSHTFAVQATDAVGNTDASAASYTWQISLNSAPVATNDTPDQVVVGDGNAVLLDVLSNDTDPDAGQTLQIASVQSPSAQNGAVQISSNKASYTAPTHYSGEDTFTYTAQDNDPLNPLTSNSATVTVNVVANDARGDCNADGGVDAADFPAIVLEIFDTDISPDWWKTYTGDFVGSPRGCDANGMENSGGASVDASDLTCTVLIFFGDSCGVTNANAASTGQTATLQVAGNLAGTPGATVSAPIRLTTTGKAAAATAFTFHFDTTHFRFDSTDKDGDGIPDALHLTAPERFTASVQTNGATGEINVALYGATLPLPTLTDGVIATVDLQVVGVRDGQTPAVQLSNASLSDNQGQAIPLTVNNVDGQTSTLVTLHLYLPIAAR